MTAFEKPPATAPSTEDVAPPVASPRHSEELLALLYGKFQRELLIQALRLTNNDHQWAEDVVQETLIRAWQNSDRLRLEPRMLSGWLNTVARRIVIDGWRSRRTRPLEVELTVSDELGSVADGTDRSVSVMEIRDVLRRLTDKQRTVVVATYVCGYTVREAAVILGVPEGTVKSRLHNSTRAIRRALWD